MTVTFTGTTTLETTVCPACAAQYALVQQYLADRRKDGKSWHCPYCRCITGFTESENDRLKRELTWAEAKAVAERSRHDQTRAELKHTEARRCAEKAQKTKIKNRVANGVCPCCNRTFVNLARHMANQHPEFTNETE